MIPGFMLFYEFKESLAQSVKVENLKMLAHTVGHTRNSQTVISLSSRLSLQGGLA
ncbi:hypothetical protein X726_06315 [Mesorhizobium sp. L103C105A0]|nr:hypothetical protein X726_06315 [Mesorhizobium sp. L103C105A0]